MDESTPTPVSTPEPTPVVAPTTEVKKGSGLAIAGMVTGISSLVIFWLWFLSIPAALTALGLSIASLAMKREGKGMAIAGIVTSALTILAIIAFFVFAFALFANNPELFETY